LTTEKKLNPSELVKCPDCDKEVKRAGLGTHRAKAHGHKAATPKKSKSKTAQQTGRELLNGEFPCPDCDFVASWQGGLTKHRGAKHPKSSTHNGGKPIGQSTDANAHQTAILTGQNGFTAHRDDEAHRLESLATFACGRITELLTSLAISHDLPPRSLAALVIRTLGQTTKVR
jgi:uncharacterized C2H2 Zn-finger protein